MESGSGTNNVNVNAMEANITSLILPDSTTFLSGAGVRGKVNVKGHNNVQVRNSITLKCY